MDNGCFGHEEIRASNRQWMLCTFFSYLFVQILIICRKMIVENTTRHYYLHCKLREGGRFRVEQKEIKKGLLDLQVRRLMAIIRCKIARVVHWTTLPGAMRSCKCGHRVVFKSQRKHKQKTTPPYLFLSNSAF
jgi:hypothetical protein